MNRRALLGGFLVVVCVATLWGVWDQRNQLAGLQADQQQLLAQVATNGSISPVAAEPGAASLDAPSPTLVITPELLRLRSEVTRLEERRNELTGVRAENDRLQAQLASRGKNGPGGSQLPPGYMRRSQAQMVGFNTPENTLQSLLWAIQNRDLTNLLQAFMAESAENSRARAGQTESSIADFFQNAAGLIGMGILSRTQDVQNGSIVLEVEIAPDAPHAQVTLRQVNGQWKIAKPF